MKKNNFAQIIPLTRLKRGLNYFDYKIPSDLLSQIKIGQVVQIPFRNKNIKGVILDLVASSKFKSEKLKSINKIIDQSPFLTSWQIKLVDYLSDYYFVSL